MEVTNRKTLVYATAMIAAICGLLFGFDTGIISGALLFIQQDFVLTTAMKELVVGSMLAGALIGCITSGRLSDYFGRRRLIILTAAIFFAGTLIAALSPSVDYLVVGRFILGIGIGIGSFIAPLYIAEVSPLQTRGGMVTINQLAITIGILVAYLINFALASTQNWRLMLGLGLVPALLLGLGMFIMPESPRWLSMRGAHSKAKNVLQQLRGTLQVDAELKEIEASLAQQKGNLKDLLAPWLRPVLVLGIMLGILQQITGINTIIYYAPTIFHMAGFQDASTSILATVGVGVVNVLVTIIAVGLIDRVGRRPLLLWGIAGMGICLAFLGLVFHLQLHPMALTNWGIHIQLTDLRWFILGSLLLYIACFAFSLGPMLYALAAEIFPLKVRSVAMGVSISANWAGNVLMSATFLSLLQVLGANHTFWLYAIICAFGFVYFYFRVPETKGCSLETIETNVRLGTPVRYIGQPKN